MVSMAMVAVEGGGARWCHCCPVLAQGEMEKMKWDFCFLCELI